MRVNAAIFWVICAFFVAATILYTVWSLIEFSQTPSEVQPFTTQGVEWVGTVAMALCAVLAGFIAFYLNIKIRETGGRLPEDIETAEIDDGDPEIGDFSPWSWWPMVLALGLAMMFLGLAVGVWISFIGAPIVLLGAVGWQFEYFRNFFAR